MVQQPLPCGTRPRLILLHTPTMRYPKPTGKLRRLFAFQVCKAVSLELGACRLGPNPRSMHSHGPFSRMRWGNE